MGKISISIRERQMLSEIANDNTLDLMVGWRDMLLNIAKRRK